ncbi:hypothetical protein DEF23_26480 [Marinitenerispora sediminis]|uniref:Uncharacterized protein n=1 Tax=Marinitenerispora sediminis TaxID=1931232 RepID=A0A368SY52_9ACTN|nr:hypothetical protein DEF28_26255 [Marinitenerispora sediminis]RCV47595.1 hypothetical protein DEF23_26480 [Marinitenerispora sediminis]RCV48420.1 hypothetical protein DEF24_26345 [Marinitenerispora sediminis]
MGRYLVRSRPGPGGREGGDVARGGLGRVRAGARSVPARWARGRVTALPRGGDPRRGEPVRLHGTAGSGRNPGGVRQGRGRRGSPRRSHADPPAAGSRHSRPLSADARAGPAGVVVPAARAAPAAPVAARAALRPRRAPAPRLTA